METFSPKEQLCIALADLFLDTDVSASHASVFRAMAEAGFSEKETQVILINDVAPAVGFNLFSSAGEWAGFKPSWLLARIETLKGRPIKRFFAKACTYFLAQRMWSDLMRHQEDNGEAKRSQRVLPRCRN